MRETPYFPRMSENSNDQIRKEFESEITETEAGAAKRTNSVIVSLVCCTALVIAAQFVSAEMSERRFHQDMTEAEYGKVGGESNYKLLQEIQRDRTANYLKDLEEKEPEYIRGLKKKIENTETAEAALVTEKGKLLKEEVAALKSTVVSRGQSGSTVSIIEFSDFACPYCKEFHNSDVLKTVASESKASYAFKALPNKKHEGSEFLARAAKCALQKSGSGAYYETVDAVFSATGSSAEAAYAEAAKIGMDKSALETCAQSAEITSLVEKDYGQGMYLKIRATPSVFVMNDETGDYVVLKGEPEEAAIRDAVTEVSTPKTE